MLRAGTTYTRYCHAVWPIFVGKQEMRPSTSPVRRRTRVSLDPPIGIHYILSLEYHALYSLPEATVHTLPLLLLALQHAKQGQVIHFTLILGVPYRPRICMRAGTPSHSEHDSPCCGAADLLTLHVNHITCLAACKDVRVSCGKRCGHSAP